MTEFVVHTCKHCGQELIKPRRLGEPYSSVRDRLTAIVYAHYDGAHDTRPG